MERGPNYSTFAELRESRLHIKCDARTRASEIETNKTCNPSKEETDFSGAFRKENKKPVTTLPSRMEVMTPP
ncbi:zinc finger protein squeeze [Spatholobus suberectus]|nr:zinc finger protein squeeze [Spatholobus suberectus]